MSETVNDTKARFEAFIQESYPDADIAPGSVLSELLIKLSAVVHNETYTEIQALSQVDSVEAALASTTDTFSPAIDKFASNYLTVRSQGKKSAGKLKVYVARNRAYQVRANTTFTQPALNLNYLATVDYNVSPNPEDDELQLYTVGDQYFFILPVEAAEAGTQYQVSNKTKFTLATGSNIVEFVSAEAYGNFTSGLAIETDKELIARIKSGLSNKGLLSPISIESNLQARDLSVQSLSIVGAGDEEMKRSKENDFNISTLGMADVYVRTSRGPETVTVTVNATKTGTGTWELELTDEAPGFYRIVSIFPPNSNLVGSLEIAQEAYGYSTEGYDRTNTVKSAQEARFTRYQTCSVEFVYAESPLLNIGDQMEVEVTVSYQPNIGELQSIFVEDEERIACADYLVKAVVPCFVSLNLMIYKKYATDTIPTDKIKQDIFNYINTIPFGDDLHVSKIIDICHNYSVKRVDLPVTINGEILGTDGSVVSITNTDTLQIPTDLDKGISKNTTQFFIDYYKPDGDGINLIDNIGIEVL